MLGRTHDDAAGEAYDKTARLLGLPYPGGPQLDRLAQARQSKSHRFPRHRPSDGSLDFSFSGLKTSVRYFLESEAGRNARPQDVAASFQAAVVDVLIARLDAAFARDALQCRCNLRRRRRKLALQAEAAQWGRRNNVPVFIPPPKYCTDNAAMIAAAAFYQCETALAGALELTADPNLPF